MVGNMTLTAYEIRHRENIQDNKLYADGLDYVDALIQIEDLRIINKKIIERIENQEIIIDNLTTQINILKAVLEEKDEELNEYKEVFYDN